MSQVDIKPALNHYAIASHSINSAVQQVSALIYFDPDLNVGDNEELVRKLKKMSRIERAQTLVQDIFGVQVTFADEDEALFTTQALVEFALKTDGIVEDVDLAMMAAQQRTKKFKAVPENKWLFVRIEGGGAYSKPVNTEVREMVEGTTTEVKTTSEGNLKKGEKERIANDLYVDFLANDERAKDPKLANQAFIGILMEKLEMTKAGATTYNYNMKKKHNSGAITPKPKRA